MNKRTIIGITGSLATGKTTVSSMFAKLGASRIDADKITHDLLQKDAVILKRLKRLFGEEIFSRGRIDRRKLAKKVFFKKEELDKLCRVLHPVIIRKVKEEIAKSPKASVVIVDAPLLIEAGLDKAMNIVVVVIATRKTQIKRAIERGLTKQEAEHIIASQMPLSKKAAFADEKIDSGVSLNETKKGVDRIWKKVQGT